MSTIQCFSVAVRAALLLSHPACAIHMRDMIHFIRVIGLISNVGGGPPPPSLHLSPSLTHAHALTPTHTKTSHILFAPPLSLTRTITSVEYSEGPLLIIGYCSPPPPPSPPPSLSSPSITTALDFPNTRFAWPIPPPARRTEGTGGMTGERGGELCCNWTFMLANCKLVHVCCVLWYARINSKYQASTCAHICCNLKIGKLACMRTRRSVYIDLCRYVNMDTIYACKCVHVYHRKGASTQRASRGILRNIAVAFFTHRSSWLSWKEEWSVD